MKILRVASSLHPEVTGGVGLHVHQMSARQAENGHDVTVLTSDNGDRSLPERETRSGYSVIHHREVARPVDNSIAPGLITTLHKLADNYDIIHAHSHLYFSTNMSAVFAKISDTPFAITNHGLFSQTAPQWLQKVYIPTIARTTLNTADRVFCYTDIAKRTLRERSVSSPISVISNGINCQMFMPARDTSEKNQILFVGRLKEGKGPEYLIDAFASIRSEFPDLSLKMVGDGPLREDLQKQCRLRDVEDRVTFTGELSYEEMPNVYNESMVLVSPTLTEAAVPRVVMEAWACETPAIMSNIPEVSEEHIDGAGLLAPMRDASELADKMAYLISDEEARRRMGEKGRERVENSYSWQETVDETTRALQATVDNYSHRYKPRLITTSEETET